MEIRKALPNLETKLNNSEIQKWRPNYQLVNAVSCKLRLSHVHVIEVNLFIMRHSLSAHKYIICHNARQNFVTKLMI